MLAYATTWMKPEGISKHEIKLQKDKYDMILFGSAQKPELE